MRLFSMSLKHLMFLFIQMYSSHRGAKVAIIWEGNCLIDCSLGPIFIFEYPGYFMTCIIMDNIMHKSQPVIFVYASLSMTLRRLVCLYDSYFHFMQDWGAAERTQGRSYVKWKLYTHENPRKPINTV